MDGVPRLSALTVACHFALCLPAQGGVLHVASGETKVLFSTGLAPLRYDDIHIEAGGTLLVDQWTGETADKHKGQLYLLAPSIRIDGKIVADGAGYATSVYNMAQSTSPPAKRVLWDGGPGEGQWGPDAMANPYLNGSGGGYGGRGGHSQWTRGSGGATYGSRDSRDETGAGHFEMGSAGGYYWDEIFQGGWPPRWMTIIAQAGHGGGAIVLEGADIVVNGEIRARGAQGGKKYDHWGAGGGSGGQIVIDARRSLTVGAGAIIDVTGGLGCSPHPYVDSSGGGGGGRIKIFVGPSNYEDLGGQFLCAGGVGADHYADGEAGTFDLNPEIPTPGDTDRDGDIDHLDYLTIKRAFGSAGVQWGSGDFDGDEDVDFYDYAAARVYFSILAITGQGPQPAVAVPEPATLSLLALGGLALVRRRRR